MPCRSARGKRGGSPRGRRRQGGWQGPDRRGSSCHGPRAFSRPAERSTAGKMQRAVATGGVKG
ncbi:hypothetical protein EWH10_19165 [Sphingobium fuliginis]|uniref:Uncharacterized protein n=1 Tax=Sphingobium fuliginis ATCC 27551 TaxID=1208342 RepID=A0A5B8CJD2_SPHSA|nr:hypothetical protein FIL70_16230 [Sphingobium fuliginis ATCC 27551]RYL96457.1 hypothetical protein EWH10_19165 [Sphingobium fuliginis]